MFTIDSPFTMVVLVMIVIFGSVTLMEWMKLRHKQEEGATEGELDGMRKEIRELTARVKTLEAVVTDPDRQLSDKIRGL